MNRKLLEVMLIAAVWLMVAGNSMVIAKDPGEPKPTFEKKTYTYKTVGKLKIKADVYRPQDSLKRPVIVWLHGGALIMGSRAGVPPQIKQLSKQEGFVIVSLDYRLAPEAKLAEIIDDVKDGLTWVRKSGPELFAAEPSRMVVAGASAGGYLTMMSGIIIEPTPTALVAYWGFGDINGDWTTKPNQHYRKRKLITEKEAWENVGKQVLTATDRNTGRGRGTFFTYLKQNGLWVKVVSGLDPKAEAKKIDAFCPIRNLSAKYPPIMMLHGTADTDVPVEQSLNMATELKRLGLSHELITIENGGHGLWGGDRKLIDQAFKRSMEYIRQQLSAL